MNSEELEKLQAYFRRILQNPLLEVRARKQKSDSAELYIKDEFLGVIYRDDDEEGDYNFSMAVLGVDLD